MGWGLEVPQPQAPRAPTSSLGVGEREREAPRTQSPSHPAIQSWAVVVVVVVVVAGGWSGASGQGRLPTATAHAHAHRAHRAPSLCHCGGCWALLNTQQGSADRPTCPVPSTSTTRPLRLLLPPASCFLAAEGALAEEPQATMLAVPTSRMRDRGRFASPALGRESRELASRGRSELGASMGASMMVAAPRRTSHPDGPDGLCIVCPARLPRLCRLWRQSLAGGVLANELGGAASEQMRSPLHQGGPR